MVLPCSRTASLRERQKADVRSRTEHRQATDGWSMTTRPRSYRSSGRSKLFRHRAETCRFQSDALEERATDVAIGEHADDAAPSSSPAARAVQLPVGGPMQAHGPTFICSTRMRSSERSSAPFVRCLQRGPRYATPHLYDVRRAWIGEAEWRFRHPRERTRPRPPVGPSRPLRRPAAGRTRRSPRRAGARSRWSCGPRGTDRRSGARSAAPTDPGRPAPTSPAGAPS